MSVRNCIQQVQKLGTGPFETLDPFLFCVYHNDMYPAGNDKCEAPRRGNGADFNPNQEYRMYHGERVPGFPQHPHRGFETMTATIDGIIDHADSLGSGGRYGFGDNQWMTAGKGIVHGEMFPLVNNDDINPLRFFQIWLNLPASNKMVDPSYVMHWAEDVPGHSSGGANMTIWAGQPFHSDPDESMTALAGLPPPPKSWASDPHNEVGVYHIMLKEGASLVLPAAKGGAHINRRAFYVEGTSLTINGQQCDPKTAVTLDASVDVHFMNVEGSGKTELLVLQGRPIGEPIAKHGPFVMNTQGEIRQAFADYQKTQFGGWPWPRDDMHFGRDKGRFSKQNGIEESPPAPATGVQCVS